MKLVQVLYVFLVFTFLASFITGVNPQPVDAKSQISLEGTFITLWGDGAPGSAATQVAYYLATDQAGMTRMLVDDAVLKSAGGAVSINQQRVQVMGTWLNENTSLYVQSLSLEQGGGHEGIYGPQPWVSIMCKFGDPPYTEPKDLNYFLNMYSSQFPGLDHYWRELSFNLANVEGSNAFGWYVLPQPWSYYVRDGHLDWDRAAIDCTAVADDDVYFLDYVGINLMFNRELDGYAWGGGWNLYLEGQWHTYRMTWEPPWGYENIGVIGHETGHGFGLPHSYWDFYTIYDNKWDVMSDVWSNGYRGGVDPVYGTLGQHTISYHKDMLGWIDSNQMAVIKTGESMTITLEQLALPQSKNFLGARILVDDSLTHFLTVEARMLTGYDAWLPPGLYGLPGGVVLHEVNVSDEMPARIIDIDGNGNTGDPASMWEPGETYITPTLGIEMSVIAVTETGYTVNIRNRYTPLGAVEIEGPPIGKTFETLPFTATVVPDNVVPPIKYVWEASGQEPIKNTGGLSDTVYFEWQESGTQGITVTASNEFESKTDYYTIPILIPPANLEITGPDKGNLQATSNFTATITPITTTVPITYVWSIDDQLVFTHTSGITDTISIPWDNPGLHQVGVIASSPVGFVDDNNTITIYIRVYLPMGYKN